MGHAAAQAAKQSPNDQERANANFFLTLASEHQEMLLSSAQQVSAIPSFHDIPLVVIASGKPNPAFGQHAQAFQQFWNEQCQKLTSKSSKGTYILAADSRHHIHRDHPEIILDALEMLLGDMRK